MCKTKAIQGQARPSRATQTAISLQ
jgi:hypothetical protein